MIKSKFSFSKKFIVSATILCSVIFLSPNQIIAQSYRLATQDEIQRYAVTGDSNKNEGLLNAVGLTMDPSRVTASASNSNTGNGPLTDISSVIGRITNILNIFVPFLVGLAVLLIIYGIVGYISQAADEEKRKEAKNFVMWGIIAVFVMISIWGLVNILVNTFNLNTSTRVVTDTYGAPVALTTLPNTPTTVPELINRINAVGSYVLPFLISIAVFILILGIVNYVRQGDNEEKRAEARMFILWGVISIFLMLSIWGLVNILIKTFALDNTIPSLQNNIFDNLHV